MSIPRALLAAALMLSLCALGAEPGREGWWWSPPSNVVSRIAIGPRGKLRTADGACVSGTGEPCEAIEQPRPLERNGHFRVADVATTGDGNIWTVGSFAWTVDFAPEGPSQPRRVAPNDAENAFLRKQAPDGRLLWARTWGGSAHRLFTANRRVSVLGTFRGAVDFDPGPGRDVRTNPARGAPLDEAPASHFIAHYTEEGAYRGVWVIPSWLPITAAMSSAGEMAIAGSFSGAEELDPSSGRRVFRAAAARDAFVTVMRPDGAYGYTRTLPALRMADLRYSEDGTLWALANPLGPDGQTAFDSFLLRVSQKGMESVRMYLGTSPSQGRGLSILGAFPDGGLLLGGNAGRSLMAPVGRDLRPSEQRSEESAILATRISHDGTPVWTLLLPSSASLESAVLLDSRVCLSMRLKGGPYDFSLGGEPIPVGSPSINGSSTALIGCIEESALRLPLKTR